MSGIAGIIHFDGTPAEPGLIDKMTSAMPYRGLDGVNHLVLGSVALGQCMLRTTQESHEETQPLTTEDETLALVMDGWLSNWEELREELLTKGAKLRTRADAELVLRAYEAWGVDCLAHIDGDFSFVIWDDRQRLAFCARDRIGNKPFTYHYDGKTLVFASELHAILGLPWVPEVPNEGMIAEIASDELMSQDETIWTGVNRLTPSSYMTVSANGVFTGCYWRPDIHQPLPYKRDEDYFEHYRALLFEIVRRYSRSDAALACEVSGGLDSSAIFSVAESLRRDLKLLAPGLKGYTFDIQSDANANEISYARDVGKHLGLTISEIPPALPSLDWYADMAFHSRNFPGFPNGESHASIYEIASQRGHRAVLVGVGGDQFLNGSFAYYFEELMQGNFFTVGRCLVKDVQALGAGRACLRLLRCGLVPFAPPTIRKLARSILQILTGQFNRQPYWLSAHLQETLNSRRRRTKSKLLPRFERRGQIGLFQGLYYPFDTFGRELMETVGIRNALEIRRPFYDRKFIEFAFATPDRLRSIGKRSKFIHTESLKGLLPENVRLRNTKAEFSVLFDTQLRPLHEHFTTKLPRVQPEWFDSEGMRTLWMNYLDRPEGQSWCLWQSLAVALAVGSRLE